MFIFEITIIITLGVYVAFLLEIKYIEDFEIRTSLFYL